MPSIRVNAPARRIENVDDLGNITGVYVAPGGSREGLPAGIPDIEPEDPRLLEMVNHAFAGDPTAQAMLGPTVVELNRISANRPKTSPAGQGQGQGASPGNVRPSHEDVMAQLSQISAVLDDTQALSALGVQEQKLRQAMLEIGMDPESVNRTFAYAEQAQASGGGAGAGRPTVTQGGFLRPGADDIDEQTAALRNAAKATRFVKQNALESVAQNFSSLKAGTDRLKAIGDMRVGLETARARYADQAAQSFAHTANDKGMAQVNTAGGTFGVPQGMVGDFYAIEDAQRQYDQAVRNMDPRAAQQRDQEMGNYPQQGPYETTETQAARKKPVQSRYQGFEHFDEGGTSGIFGGPGSAPGRDPYVEQETGVQNALAEIHQQEAAIAQELENGRAQFSQAMAGIEQAHQGRMNEIANRMAALRISGGAQVKENPYARPYGLAG